MFYNFLAGNIFYRKGRPKVTTISIADLNFNQRPIGITFPNDRPDLAKIDFLDIPPRPSAVLRPTRPNITTTTTTTPRPTTSSSSAQSRFRTTYTFKECSRKFGLVCGIGNVQLWLTSWQFCTLDGVLIITHMIKRRILFTIIFWPRESASARGPTSDSYTWQDFCYCVIQFYF